MPRKRTRKQAADKVGAPKPAQAGTPEPAPAHSVLRLYPAGRAMLWVTFGLLAALGVLLGWREIGSPDFGFHLSTAEWMWQNRWAPSTDPLTYTIPSHAYIDLQWGFQFFFFVLHHFGEELAVALATAALTLLFSSLLVFRSWRREGRIPLSALLLLILFFLGNYWEPRPHLFSWVWGSLVLLVFEEYARGNRRWLPALPAIMALWVNSHSLYVLGLVIMGAYGLTELILKKKDFDRRLLLWCAVAGAACLINPYHIQGLLFPLVQLRDIQSGAYKSTVTGISEFTSPFSFEGYLSEGRLVLFQPRLGWQIYTLLTLAGVGMAWRRIRLAEGILLAGFFYVFWKANKNFGYFVMVSFPVAAAGLDRMGVKIFTLVHRRKDEEPEADDRFRWAVGWLAGCGAVAIALMGLTWSGRLYEMSWSGQKPGVGFSKELLPVEACEFINENKIKGRILNTWGQGGYISWATRQKVFMYSHGEVTGPEFYQEYILGKQPGRFELLLEKYMPTVAIVPFKVASYWLYYLDRQDEWRMVYADRHTAIFLLNSVAPEVKALPAPQPEKDYPVFDEATTSCLISEAVNAEKPGLGVWLQGRAAYPMREMALSSFYLHTSEVDACIGISLLGLDHTRFLVPELLLNLGHALNARKRYELADPCFDAFLRSDDDPVIAAEIAAARRARSF